MKKLPFIAGLICLCMACNDAKNNSENTIADSTLSAKDTSTVNKAAANLAQTAEPPEIIEMVVSKNYLPPIVNFSSPGLDAANAIVSEFNKWAAIKCSQTIDASLKTKWDENKIKYVGAFPANSKVLFLVLVDKFTCNVIGMLPESQVVRVKDNVCSVGDIKVDRPDLIYDPAITGFFTVKIKF